MKKLILLPTWLLARFVMLFTPHPHPWKRTPITFEQWVENATDLCKLLAVFFWLSTIFSLWVWYVIS